MVRPGTSTWQNEFLDSPGSIMARKDMLHFQGGWLRGEGEDRKAGKVREICPFQQELPENGRNDTDTHTLSNDRKN